MNYVLIAVWQTCILFFPCKTDEFERVYNTRIECVVAMRGYQKRPDAWRFTLLECVPENEFIERTK